MKYCPLVSAKVLTYNSSEYIIETLESIKNQDYPNLELVISDDCSKDNTVQLCKEWAKANESRFHRIKILESDFNRGISANANRSFGECQGEWVKGVAGDDLMMPDCISTYIEFVRTNPGYNVIFARLRSFKVENGVKLIEEVVPADEKELFYKEFNEQDPHEQFYMLLRDGCFLQAPTSFFRTSFIKEHPYTELYKYEEDYPMWLKLTKQGVKFHVLFKETVLYRIGNSLSHRKLDYYSRNYMSTRSLFFWNECLAYFKQEGLMDSYNRYRKQLLRYELTEAFTQNHKSKWNNFVVRIIAFLVNKFGKYEL